MFLCINLKSFFLITGASCNPGWPQILCIAKDNFELLNLLYPPQVLGLQVCSITLSLCGAEDGNQGLLRGRQALCPLTAIPSPGTLSPQNLVADLNPCFSCIWRPAGSVTLGPRLSSKLTQ